MRVCKKCHEVIQFQLTGTGRLKDRTVLCGYHRCGCGVRSNTKHQQRIQGLVTNHRDLRAIPTHQPEGGQA